MKGPSPVTVSHSRKKSMLCQITYILLKHSYKIYHPIKLPLREFFIYLIAYFKDFYSYTEIFFLCLTPATHPTV